MKILGTELHFLENLRYSAKRYSLWWAILIVTIVFDVFTTYAFTSRYGIKAEGNLVARLLMASLDPMYGNLIGKLLQLFSVLVVVGVSRKVGNFFLLFVILLNCWAIVLNSMAL